MGSGIIFNNNPTGTFNPNGNNLTNTTLSVNTLFKDLITFDNSTAILFDTGSTTQFKGSVQFNASSTLTFDAFADVNFNTGSSLTLNNGSTILFDTGSIVQSKVLFGFVGGGLSMQTSSIFINTASTFTLQNSTANINGTTLFNFIDSASLNFAAGTSLNMSVGSNTNFANLVRITGATATSGLHNISGAVANPSYSFGADTNTGIYNDTASSLSFACNGVRQFRIRSGGILTGNPLSGAAAQFFKVGGYTAGATVATGYVNIEIAGVVYRILTST